MMSFFSWSCTRSTTRGRRTRSSPSRSTSSTTSTSPPRRRPRRCSAASSSSLSSRCSARPPPRLTASPSHSRTPTRQSSSSSSTASTDRRSRTRSRAARSPRCRRWRSTAAASPAASPSGRGTSRACSPASSPLCRSSLLLPPSLLQSCPTMALRGRRSSSKATSTLPKMTVTRGCRHSCGLTQQRSFLEYVHAGDPVDVTFGIKELKAFLTFCEGCEVDILLFFEKAGEPVLLVPRFGLDDGSHSDFDVTLALSTLLVSQLDGNVAQQPGTSAHQAEEPRAAAAPSPVPENFSNHTRIWSELSGITPKSVGANTENHAQKERNGSASVLNDISMLPNVINARCKPPITDNSNYIAQPAQMDHFEEPHEVMTDNPRSQHHPSNWVGADEDDDDDDEELFVQTTPHYMD